MGVLDCPRVTRVGYQPRGFEEVFEPNRSQQSRGAGPPQWCPFGTKEHRLITQRGSKLAKKHKPDSMQVKHSDEQRFIVEIDKAQFHRKFWVL